jgi:hypothetical protein
MRLGKALATWDKNRGWDHATMGLLLQQELSEGKNPCQKIESRCNTLKPIWYTVGDRIKGKAA